MNPPSASPTSGPPVKPNRSSRRERWLVLPLLLITSLALLGTAFLPRPSASDHLSIGEIRTQVTDQNELRILGVITNSGPKRWSSVEIEVEFFDPDGNFLGESSDFLRSDIGPHANENFELALPLAPAAARDGSAPPVLKIIGGS